MKLKLGDKHSSVSRLQEALNCSPFPRPEDFEELEVDGDYGKKTEEAVTLLQSWLNFAPIDGVGVADEQTIHFLWNLYGIDQPTNYIEYLYIPPFENSTPIKVIDGRDVNPPPKNFYGKYRTNTNSIMLHQTGCGMPDNPMFWAKVNAHVGVLQSGTVILMHSWDKIIWHGHGLSSRSIGIEIEGNMRGIESKDNTYWKPGGGPHSLTEEQAYSLNNYLLPVIKNYIEGLGNKFEFVYAHRQSSDQRSADPGSKVWDEVGLYWQNELDVKSIELVTGSGKPIPKEWDPDSPYKYWG